MSLRSAENLTKIIENYLKRNDIFYEDTPWEIRESTLGGLGVFAKRNIEVGELIFIDKPVILGPRCVDGLQEFCVNCLTVTNLKSCKNNCGLPLCSDPCQNSFDHQRECKLIRLMSSKNHVENRSVTLLKCLTPLRSLLLSDEDKEIVRHLKYHKGKKHGHEIDVLSNDLLFEIKDDDKQFLKLVCSVLDANAFEVITGSEENQSGLRGRKYYFNTDVTVSCLPYFCYVSHKAVQKILPHALSPRFTWLLSCAKLDFLFNLNYLKNHINYSTCIKYMQTCFKTCFILIWLMLFISYQQIFLNLGYMHWKYLQKRK